MNEKTDGEFSEFPGLAARLRRADFSGESRVRSELRERLLARAEKSGRGSGFFWLLPAAALAAALLMVNVRHKPLPGAPREASYDLPYDGYGQCGRQGLGDYMAEERY